MCCVQAAGALLPILHLHSVSAWLFEVLIPITGRITLPLEVAVALLVGLIAALPSGTVAALLHATSLSPPHPPPPRRNAGSSNDSTPSHTPQGPPRWRLCPAAAVSRGLLLLSGVALVVAVRRSPFTPAAPKRLLVQHVSREVDGVPQLGLGLVLVRTLTVP